jgi:hypothetical protein
VSVPVLPYPLPIISSDFAGTAKRRQATLYMLDFNMMAKKEMRRMKDRIYPYTAKIFILKSPKGSTAG